MKWSLPKLTVSEIIRLVVINVSHLSFNKCNPLLHLPVIVSIHHFIHNMSKNIKKKLHYSTQALHYGIFGLAFLKQQSKTETYSALII